ncbi:MULTISPECIES: SIR2-like domain protein [unclassified Leptospira]|uniref:SIR2-like domain protein n=1 Tax=unclassified Leptospira TaxID=2633828 RepID=UPI0002BDDC1C|nr:MULTISPECIES: SIR2-like domain protein [unclassified Leptospira]EMK00161.1 SIR2-like domain protein [Leptospira sp. B5-022]MCR1795748.1 SIR2 family protein [Leptospira sp. id769339]
MRGIVIGAGASFSESLAVNAPIEFQMPLVKNFARQTWFDWDPGIYLYLYLLSININVTDTTQMNKQFFELEANGDTNIEKFFEFAWNNRNHPLVLQQSSLPGIEIGISPWENMLYHSFGKPLHFIMLQAFHENGVGFVRFIESEKIIKKLNKDDLILNLNYDTIFEIALQQNSLSFKYEYIPPTSNEITVFKPHGSLNMLISKDGYFAFSQPEAAGHSIEGWACFIGLVPPRLNKNYLQHPISAQIMANMKSHPKPNILTFWGVGITESDIDLNEIYKDWSISVDSIEVINPDKQVADKVSHLLGKKVDWYPTVDEWVNV